MMELEKFWSVVERVRQKHAASCNVPGELGLGREGPFVETLAELPPAELIEFAWRFDERLIAAYHWEPWAALYVIEESIAGDNKFEYFRAELILSGRAVFEAALQNADILADVSPVPTGVEGLADVPRRVYEQAAGRELPENPTRGPHPNEPAGAPWQESDLPGRLPRLWKLYGNPEIET